MTNGPTDPSLILNAQELRGLDIFNGAGGIPCSLCHEVNAATNVWQANNGLDLVPLDPGTTVPALQRDGSVVYSGPRRFEILRSLRLICTTAASLHCAK